MPLLLSIARRDEREKLLVTIEEVKGANLGISVILCELLPHSIRETSSGTYQ